MQITKHLLPFLGIAIAYAAVSMSEQRRTTHVMNYTVSDLGLPRGTSVGADLAAAYSVNDREQVAGTAQRESGTRAFLYSRGTMASLGTLGGYESHAWAINNAGVVVGMSNITREGEHAFVYCRSQMRDIGMSGLSDGRDRSDSVAYAVNARGDVVGRANNAPFLWRAGRTTILTGFKTHGRSEARGINDSEQIIVNVQPAVSEIMVVNASLWEKGKITELVPGLYEIQQTYARAINNRGQVVGWTTALPDRSPATGGAPKPPVRAQAFVWQGGVLHLLNTPDGVQSEACAINDAGNIVGWCDTPDGPVSSLRMSDDPQGGSDSAHHVAFVYTDGTMYDLNRLIPAGSGWILQEAWSINRQGQIVGFGTHDGNRRAFMLTPSNSRFPR